jgi:hypothetical protein
MMTNNNPFNPFIPQGGTDLPLDPNPSTGPVPMPGASPADNEEFTVDLTGVQSNFTVPDGEYTVQCIGVESGISQSENPMYIWDFVIVDNPKYQGREFKVFTALTPAAMWKVAETVEALGIGAQGQTVRFTRKDVLNKKCKAEIQKTMYNGQERSQIQKLSKL